MRSLCLAALLLASMPVNAQPCMAGASQGAAWIEQVAPVTRADVLAGFTLQTSPQRSRRLKGKQRDLTGRALSRDRIELLIKPANRESWKQLEAFGLPYIEGVPPIAILFPQNADAE
ncbi:MAG: hypothetical protein ACFCUR_18080 [Rhodomicrobiaceae bacterium]